MLEKNVRSVCGIYCIKNIINDKMYIGQSVNCKDRLRTHRQELCRNSHDNIALIRAWNKYGEDSFVGELLEECSKENLNEREQWYFDNSNWENLYNINRIASCGAKLREGLDKDQWVEKVREGVKRYKENITDEQKLRRKEAGKKSLQTKLNLGDGVVKVKPHKKHVMNKPFEYTEKRQDSYNKRKGIVCESNKVKQISFDLINPEGERVTITGVGEFCRVNELHSESIRLVRKGILLSYKGWKLPEDDPNYRTRKGS